MTDNAVIEANNMIKDSTYDRLAAWGRRWLPLLSVIFIAIAGVFSELTKVPGLEHVAPWFVALGGIFAAVSAGINEFLKRAKELWTDVENKELTDPENSHISESGLDLSDPENLDAYYFMNQAERLKFIELHHELFPKSNEKSEE